MYIYIPTHKKVIKAFGLLLNMWVYKMCNPNLIWSLMKSLTGKHFLKLNIFVWSYREMKCQSHC